MYALQSADEWQLNPELLHILSDKDVNLGQLPYEEWFSDKPSIINGINKTRERLSLLNNDFFHSNHVFEGQYPRSSRCYENSKAFVAFSGISSAYCEGWVLGRQRHPDDEKPDTWTIWHHGWVMTQTSDRSEVAHLDITWPREYYVLSMEMWGDLASSRKRCLKFFKTYHKIFKGLVRARTVKNFTSTIFSDQLLNPLPYIDQSLEDLKDADVINDDDIYNVLKELEDQVRTYHYAEAINGRPHVVSRVVGGDNYYPFPYVLDVVPVIGGAA